VVQAVLLLVVVAQMVAGNAVGFNFIGLDSDGREKYDVGGDSFTLFVVCQPKYSSH
jgi:hypothetical protein